MEKIQQIAAEMAPSIRDRLANTVSVTASERHQRVISWIYEDGRDEGLPEWTDGRSTVDRIATAILAIVGDEVGAVRVCTGAVKEPEHVCRVEGCRKAANKQGGRCEQCFFDDA